MRQGTTVGVAVFALTVSTTAGTHPVYSFQGLMEPVGRRARGQARAGTDIGRPHPLHPAGRHDGRAGAERGGWLPRPARERPDLGRPLKGFAVGAGPFLAVYAYAWKHEGEAPTVRGGPAALAAAVGLFGGIGALIGVGVDRRHSQTPEFHLAPLDAGASLSIAW